VSPAAFRSHALVLAAYAAIAVAFSWPLPLHFTTHLTGATTGDTGVYVWNQWVFQRAFAQRDLPYFTDAIFSLSGDDTNLSLHNYTIFQDLLALPLLRGLGVVATFNLVMLISRVLTAYSTFLLARHVTSRAAEAFVAGLAFAWSPVLMTRSMGHFSLVAAAPLAVFLLLLAHFARRGCWGLREAVCLGLVVSWATIADPYYGIYCLLLGATYLAVNLVRVFRVRAGGARVAHIALDVLIAAFVLLVAALAAGGGWRFAIFDQPISVQGLYTPVLLLTLLIGARLAWHYRFSLAVDPSDVWRSLRMVIGTGVASAVLLSPLLYALARRVISGGLDQTPHYWRSSPRGVDLLALLLPNPNHPLAPDLWRSWLAGPAPDAYLENVASVPLTAVALMGVAWALGWRPARWWVCVTVLSGALALGPFIHVAGANTFVPGPWAFLRYVPVIELARTPARFSIVLMLGTAVLLASALASIAARWPQYRRRIVALVALVLFLELLPVPRTLHSADVPSIYAYVAASPPDTRVLHLPFGVRDGTASEGDFNAQTQYFQTAHGRRLIGGYLSRVSQRRRLTVRREPVLDALITLSENRGLDPEQFARFVRDAPAFLRRAKVGFVVIDRSRIPSTLDARAVGALGLALVDVDGRFELYKPLER
jgi:hypothetical protein